MAVFVGVDWGCGSHAVCVVDAKGQVLDRFQVGHDREGLAALIARLGKHGDPGQTRVAIERPTGLLVDALVQAGFVVVPIHPNVVKACVSSGAPGPIGSPTTPPSTPAPSRSRLPNPQMVDTGSLMRPRAARLAMELVEGLRDAVWLEEAFGNRVR